MHSEPVSQWVTLWQSRQRTCSELSQSPAINRIFLMRQMPRESRHSGKLPTHDNGEKGRSDMTHARRQIPNPVLLSCTYSKGPSCRTNSSRRSCSPARCLPSLPLLRPALRPRMHQGCAQGSRLSGEQRRCADTRSGEAGARYASGRQEARADDRYAAGYRQCLAAGASRAGTATRDSTHGGQPWRTAVADGVRAGRRDLARDRRYGADADALSSVLLLVRANGQRSDSL